MSAQLALPLAFLEEPSRPRALRAVDRPLPRALRIALATVAKDSTDGRAYAALESFFRRYGDARTCVLPRELRKYARRLNLQIGDNRR